MKEKGVEDIAYEPRRQALYAPADCTHPIRYYKSCAACGAPSTNEADLFEVGVALGHSFTVETVSGAALHTPADCNNPATYYKSCSRCDAISTSEDDLFEHGDALEHDFTTETVTDVSAYGFTGNKGNYYYVDLAAGFGVTVADCVIGDYTLKYQPVCYVRAVLESEAAPENLKQLVTALYLYYRMSQMS